MGVRFDSEQQRFVFDFEHDGQDDIVSLTGEGYQVAAMTCVECGCPPSAVPIGSLNTGFILAGLSDPHLTSDWW